MHPITISDLFGIAISTTQRWAQYEESWADYLTTNQTLATNSEPPAPHALSVGPIATE